MDFKDIPMDRNFMDIIYGKEPLVQEEPPTIENCESGQDQYGYPFEPIDTYSTDPLGFIETARMLEAEANNAFLWIRRLNHESPLFLKISAKFEKMLNQLGSICITKAVIEQRKENTFEFDGYLRGITIDWLRGMAAFNFRKIYDTYMDAQDNFSFNQEAFALSLRLAALDKRLHATAEKIEQIKAGKVKVELQEKAPELKELNSTETGSWNKDQGSSEPVYQDASVDQDPENQNENQNTAPLTASGRSLPIDRNAIREWEKQNFLPDEISEAAQAAETDVSPAAYDQAEETNDLTDAHTDEADDLPTRDGIPVERIPFSTALPAYMKWLLPQYDYADPGG